MKKSILLSNSLIHALNDASTVVVAMILPVLYSRHFIITRYSDIGILSNLGLLVTFIFQFLVVRWEAKFELRHMLLFSMVGISLSLMLISTASSFAALLGFFIIMRFFVSFYHPIGVSWISRVHAGHGLDLAMGVQSGSGNLGVFLAFVSVGFLAQKFSWKTPLILWALLCFLVALTSYTLIRKASTLQETSAAFSKLSSWIATLKQIKIFVPGFIFGGACWGTTVFYAPSLLHHRFNIPLGKTGFFLSLWILLGTVMTYFFGLLRRKFRRWTICLTAFSGASFFLVLLGLARSRTLAVLSLFLFGSFLFLNFPALQAFVGDSIQANNKTMAYSLSANIQMGTGAIISLISGFLSDYYGINAPFLFAACLGIGTSLFYLFLKKK